MSRGTIATNKAPAAIGPYSQAVQTGPFLFISGQIPLDPESGEIVNGDIRIQTERVMENIRAILQSAGQTMSAIAKCTIFLTDLSEFDDVNDVYGRYFKSNPPARATVQVSALPKNVNIEVEALAWIG
jgi:2-iminobutanoate/2-iminopropanoate deaminase